MHQTEFQYGHESLGIGAAIELAAGRRKGIIPPAVERRIRAGQQQVSDIVSQQKTVYGINTGFGILANTKISEDDTRILQHKILQSHSVGVGAPIPAEIARI